MGQYLIKHVLIERVLLGVLRKHGLDDCEIALLERARRLGSCSAQRLLDDIAGSKVHTDIPCAVGDGRPLAGYHTNPVTIAAIDLGGGYGWYKGNLLDPGKTIPSTIVLGAQGLPIGKLIDHPDIDPEAIIQKQDPEFPLSIATVPIESTMLEIPRFPKGRLRLARRFFDRRKIDRPIQKKVILGYTISALASLTSFASQAFYPFPDSPSYQALTVAMGITTVIICIMALDSYLNGLIIQCVSKRARLGYKIPADMRHDYKMHKLLIARGYTSEGRPMN